MLPIRDIIVLALIIGSLPFCFFKPFFGILMWNVVSLLNPHRFTWGLAFDFPVALLVAVPTLAGAILFERNWKHFFSRNVMLIVVLWLWFTFTTLRNTEMLEFMHFAPDTWYRWGVVSKILLMTLATIGIVNSWYRLRWLALVMSACLGFLVVKAVPFMILTGGSFRLYGPPGSMLADNNDLGLALNMTLPFFFFLARTEPLPRIRWAMGFVFVATIPGVLFTYSRGALLGLAVVLLLMVMKSRQRVMLIPILLLAALFAVFLTPEKWQQRMNFTREGAVLDDSALSRINAWTYSWNLVLDHPLTGGGFEAFTPELFRRYAPNANDVHGPHSIYFGVLAEHGFIGLFLYLCLLVSCLLTLRRVRKYAKTAGDERAVSYAAMLQLSLIAFMSSGAFLGRTYFDYYFTIVACIAILSRLCKFESLLTTPADLELEAQPA